MSTRPNLSTAALTIASQFSSELGRLPIVSTLAPSVSHAAATFLTSAALPAASTRLAPAPASTLAASAPKAPDAPVTIAVLPLMSNSDSGFFRRSSAMKLSLCSSWPGLSRPISLGLGRPCEPKRDARDKPGHDECASLGWRRDRHQHGDDVVAAVDDLPALVGADEAGIVCLEHGLLAVD